ncbi:protein GAMETE CELL DEFECTIVE 1, mitochondrial [Argentina anserina]|uniref:protein GAMETE CELL DEFECTIVE 1, mitochondrial n=1 Tax=Argentina anserina TaxID=57926 RepID=UPI0021763650|nr:protein GAMETE CELL DEFECTIVE 1, mitochondrial [Potentilla anserina]
MQNLHRLVSRISSTSIFTSTNARLLREKGRAGSGSNGVEACKVVSARLFSFQSGGDGGNEGGDGWDKPAGGMFSGNGSDNLGWDTTSTWSLGLSQELAGLRVKREETPESPVSEELREIEKKIKKLEAENGRSKRFIDGWGDRLKELSVLMKQLREPGARGCHLKDSEKAEMYRLHKENPDVYTVERLAKDYRIMRQRVHAILWLKELQEEEEKKLGRPLDDSVELLLDSYPEFFSSHDREFHVASLPYKPDFKVMPEGWDGTTRDLDEVHYEISKREDEMLYQEFVQRMNFNKMKMRGEVFRHKYSRRRSADGWNFTVEKMGPKGKRGSGGGWKFVSLPDGSSRPLNEMEKMYVKRETPRHRRKIHPVMTKP